MEECKSWTGFVCSFDVNGITRLRYNIAPRRAPFPSATSIVNPNIVCRIGGYDDRFEVQEIVDKFGELEASLKTRGFVGLHFAEELYPRVKRKAAEEFLRALNIHDKFSDLLPYEFQVKSLQGTIDDILNVVLESIEASSVLGSRDKLHARGVASRFYQSFCDSFADSGLTLGHMSHEDSDNFNGVTIKESATFLTRNRSALLGESVWKRSAEGVLSIQDGVFVDPVFSAVGNNSLDNRAEQLEIIDQVKRALSVVFGQESLRMT